MKNCHPMILRATAICTLLATASAQAPELQRWLGTWNSTFGDLTLTLGSEGELEGDYSGGRIEHAKLKGVRLNFQYVESSVRGEGWFELANDQRSFSGAWRPLGTERWALWSGTRAEDPPGAYDGLWQTTFGAMRLQHKGNEVRGAYARGERSSLIGQTEGERLTFTYEEADAKGEGWFETANDGQSFEGKWRQEGSLLWRKWAGRRISPQRNVRWLVILEARWELGLAEREYAFGDMLQSYFTMAPARHIRVRHRFFHDRADFQRFARELRFLAEPVTVVVSSHGSENGVAVNGSILTASDLSDAFTHAYNVDLLHLSGCSMMNGSVPAEIHEKLRGGPDFPISGYAETVAWDASAISDFIYLSMVLIRRMGPEDAVAQTHLVAPYTATETPEGAAFASMGLSVRPAPVED
jgi:hypothetical protein